MNIDDRFLKILACPECHGNMTLKQNSFKCDGCGIDYAIDNNIPVLVNNIESLLDEKDKRSELQNKVYAEAGKYFYSSFCTTLIYGLVRTISEKIARKNVLRLDLGCASGEHFKCTDQKDNIIGFDVTMDFLKMAQKQFKDPLYIQGTAYKLPFKDASLPSVYSLCALEHIQDIDQCMSEVHRVLEPGGEFVFSLASENAFYNMCRKLTIRRYIEKQFDIDYIKWTTNEHCSFSLDIINAAKKKFNINTRINIPFFVPFYPLSLFLVVKATKAD